MPSPPAFDTAAAHRYFAADCFNKVWSLIEKTERTAEDDEAMLRLCYASIWHWTQRDDCKQSNLSIGYWQLSRVCSILRRTADALHYGNLCLRYSSSESPFLLGYAHEALARAEKLSGNSARCAEHLAEASRLAASVADEGDRKMLLDDLGAIYSSEST